MKNFNSIRNSVNVAVIHLMKEDKKRAKSILTGYQKILKTSPGLRETLYLHENFEKGAFKNEDVAHGFIIENLIKIKNLNKTKLKKDLNKLENFMVENKLPILEFNDTIGDKVSTLIVNLNKTNKSLENNKIIETLIEEITTRKPLTEETEKREPVNQKIFKKVMSEKYNKKYSSLTEQEKLIVKAFVSGNQKTIKEEYNKTSKSIINTIKNLISESKDDQIKMKYYEVQSKLYDGLELDEITIPHFQKLFELEKTLK